MNETGGTVRVAGTITFSYEVASADCNVFSIEELVEKIQADKIGWFIDYYLGTPDVEADEETFEKYQVINFITERGEGHTIEQVEEITERYNVPDPDCVHGDYVMVGGIPRCKYCGGDEKKIIEYGED